MEKQQLKQYYQEAELYLPSNPKWRYYVFKLNDGKIKRFHIKDINELRKLLIKFLPLKVYFSSGAWLNVENIRGRKNNNFAIKIFEDVIFDIDSENINNAIKSALDIINNLGNPDKIVKTTRGFHLWYLQRKNKKEMIDKVNGIKDLDIHCTENEFNVFALPKTIKDDKICDFITIEELHNLYNSRDTSKMGEIPNETAERHLRRNVSEKMQSKVNEREMGIEGTILSFSNQVKRGIYIPILIYEKDYKGIKSELDRLNVLYNLGDMYAFESDKYYTFISIRCFDERQLKKLLNNSNSITKIQQKKFKKIWFDISNYQLMGVLRYKVHKFFRASNKHYNYFIDCGIKPIVVDELVGNHLLKLYEVHKT